MIRIQLVDSHALVRAGLRLLIDRTGVTVVVAESATAADAVATAVRERPDVILFEPHLGSENDLECIRQLRCAVPESRVLVVTSIRDSQVHLQAIRLGACGVVVKDRNPELLIRAIERVHAGESWVERTTTASLLAELASTLSPTDVSPFAATIGQLTDRERDVIALIAEGFRNRQIAERLNVSEATVRHHLTSIFAKLRVPDRVTLTIFAIRHGIARRSA
jgi:DNA-binding NarL/FixJ family response regulator